MPDGKAIGPLLTFCMKGSLQYSSSLKFTFWSDNKNLLMIVQSNWAEAMTCVSHSEDKTADKCDMTES